jgi:hypothetical protein
MQYFATWSEALAVSFQQAWFRFAEYLPSLVGALVILLLGLMIASAVGAVVRSLIKASRIDAGVERMGITGAFSSYGIRFSVSSFVGWLARWFVILAVLIALVDALKIPRVSDFLSAIALYIPNVVAAVLIMSIGLLVSEAARRTIEGIARGPGVGLPSGILATLTRWSILILTSLAALNQLGIAPRLIEILIAGFVFMVSLAGALAFGLAGRDQAGRILAALERQIIRRDKM